MHGRPGHAGQAENSVIRCKFIRCSNAAAKKDPSTRANQLGAGLRTVNFNSMDIWCWYCLFEDCDYGLYNAAGNFHAYKCVFLRSMKMDIGAANLMVFSFVNNVSVGSRCFMDWAGGHSWGSPTSITGNRIIDYTGDFAIRLGNGGPYLVMDNVFRSSDPDKPQVELTWGDQALIGNVYTSKNAVHAGKSAGKVIRLDEKVADPREIDTTVPLLPPTPPRADRKVFEVPAGAGADVIQAAINQAADLRGRRPVVHVPMGVYRISKTLVIPPNCDVQFVGDGAAETATVLQWSGPPGRTLMKLEGPSRAALRDLSVNNQTGSGILVGNCDQPGSRLLLDQLNVAAPARMPAAGPACWSTESRTPASCSAACRAVRSRKGGSRSSAAPIRRPSSRPRGGWSSSARDRLQRRPVRDLARRPAGGSERLPRDKRGCATRHSAG